MEGERGSASGLRGGGVGGCLCVSGCGERMHEVIWVPEAVTKWRASDLRLVKAGIGTSPGEWVAESLKIFVFVKSSLRYEWDITR